MTIYNIYFLLFIIVYIVCIIILFPYIVSLFCINQSNRSNWWFMYNPIVAVIPI